MNVPTLSLRETQDQQVFTALMWALSRPGEEQTFDAEGQSALVLVGQALLDLETRFFTSDPVLRAVFLRLGAKAQNEQQATYHFYPSLSKTELDSIQRAPVGSLIYPEGGATLVLSAQLGKGLGLQLSGPGIQGKRRLRVASIPEPFWYLRNNAVAFPVGWDVFLLEQLGSQVRLVGIPRSTTLEVIP